VTASGPVPGLGGTTTVTPSTVLIALVN
jgi:hypothetical protein